MRYLAIHCHALKSRQALFILTDGLENRQLVGVLGPLKGSGSGVVGTRARVVCEGVRAGRSLESETLCFKVRLPPHSKPRMLNKTSPNIRDLQIGL